VFVLLIAAIVAIYRAYAINQKANHKIKEVSDYRLNLFTNISHEFRTPLTLIKDPLECAISEGSIKGESLKRLQTAMDNVNILIKLVNDIMDLRKSEEAKMSLTLSSFNLRDLAATVIDAYQSTAKTKQLDITLSASQEYDYSIVGRPRQGDAYHDQPAEQCHQIYTFGQRITVTLSCPDQELFHPGGERHRRGNGQGRRLKGVRAVLPGQECRWRHGHRPCPQQSLRRVASWTSACGE
jgi:signal transduction histidine kinase